LNWTNEKTKKGFFSKSSGIDLDLACLYELSDGTKLVVQALGNQFGAYEKSPYIHLLAMTERAQYRWRIYLH
jgi:tellurite resistance protein TerA